MACDCSTAAAAAALAEANASPTAFSWFARSFAAFFAITDSANAVTDDLSFKFVAAVMLATEAALAVRLLSTTLDNKSAETAAGGGPDTVVAVVVTGASVVVVATAAGAVVAVVVAEVAVAPVVLFNASKNPEQVGLDNGSLTQGSTLYFKLKLIL